MEKAELKSHEKDKLKYPNTLRKNHHFNFQLMNLFLKITS